MGLDNEELWSKAYLPADRTTELQGNYEGNVIFNSLCSNKVVGIKRTINGLWTASVVFMPWKPVMIIFASGGVLPDTKDKPVLKKSSARRNCKPILNLACEYYGDNKLKKRNVKLTKLVNFQGTARHHNVDIMLYDPKKNARSIWRLVYGKIQYKSDLPTINMRLLGGHCFYIKKMDVLCE